MLRTASSRLAAPLRKGRSTALINRSGNRSSASSTRSASTIANTARRDNKESPAASSRKLFWATALCGALLSTVLAQPLLAEDAKKNGDSTSALTKDDIGVICIIGNSSWFLTRTYAQARRLLTLQSRPCFERWTIIGQVNTARKRIKEVQSS